MIKRVDAKFERKKLAIVTITTKKGRFKVGTSRDLISKIGLESVYFSQ